MTVTSTVRDWWSDYWAAGYDYRIMFLGREGVKASDFTLGAWRALERVLQFHGYGDAVWVSTYYPRPIGGYECDMDVGGYGCSLHGYSGCALDIESLLNPYVKGTSWDFSLCKFTRVQVEAVLAIRTNSGVRVWRWGGDFGDYMHWQLDCAPDDIASGIDWSTVAGFVLPPDEGDDMSFSDPRFEPAFNELVEWGVFSEYTQPQDEVRAEKFAEFLVRARDNGFFATSVDVTELQSEVTALEITVENLLTDLRSV